MKWQNKGHEFDALGAIFKKNKKLLVIGSDESLKSIKEELDFLNTEIEYKTLKEIFSISILSALKLKNRTIVIADNSQETLEKLKKFKFIKHNENVFLADDFLKKYLSIYALYVYNKVYSNELIAITMTNMCSLNCKYCTAYEPYIKNKRHLDVNFLKREMDLLFSCFDRLKYFSLTGGEPFLYPYFEELIKYFISNYIDKVKIFQIYTNGSIVPSDRLFNVLKECKNLCLVCDNYTKNAKHTSITYKKLIDKCNYFNLNYYAMDENQLIFAKSFPPKYDYTKLDNNALIRKFDNCKCFDIGRELLNGKLYQCCVSANAISANLIQYIENDILDLNKYCTGGGYSKNELIEFVLNYSEKGYAEFCKYCNGIWNNELLDENGVTQLKKGEMLEWDINNPTYL